MSEDLKVLVVGAGIAGLATSLAIAQTGVMIELVGKPETGQLSQSHINIPPNMLRDLVSLGIAKECVRSGFPYQGVAYVDQQGSEQFHRLTPHMAGPSYPAALVTSHEALTKLLFDAICQANVNLNTATCCESIEEKEHKVLARFTDGTITSYDLIIAATSADSLFLESHFGTVLSPMPVGQVWWQVLLRRPYDLNQPTFMVGKAGGFRAGAIPVDNERASLILIQPTDATCEVPKTELASVMRDRLKVCGGVFSEIRRQLNGEETVLVRPVMAGLLSNRWHCGRVLRIGNAAYVIAPHLGQAAAQCIEDAVALGGLIADFNTPEQLFESFMELRYERCQITYECSLQIARWELQPDTTTNIPASAQRQAEAVAQPLLITNDSIAIKQESSAVGRQPTQV